MKIYDEIFGWFVYTVVQLALLSLSWVARGYSGDLHYDRPRNLPSQSAWAFVYLYSEGLHRILCGLAKFTFLFTYV